MLCLMAFHRAINHQLGSGYRSFADSRFRLALIKTVLEPSLSIYFPLVQDFSTLPFFLLFHLEKPLRFGFFT